MVKSTKCVMCGEVDGKNAKIIPSIQDRHGSVKGPAFCSVKCAAIWACLHLNNEKHLCPVTNQWDFDMDGCDKCKDIPRSHLNYGVNK